ncbi:ubiquitin fusion degradation (UFD1) family [Cryptosporidium xiaoi]|uniref:Ubiquitin fusion degradation (UFD1) family n=1 Tax=Cryptosporidium xiaoi TaxID=659607 RepID=A0AAV9Y4U4_9CRYT
MDIFSSSNTFKKQEKKKILEKKKNSISNSSKLGLFFDDYLTSVERVYIKQQNNLLNDNNSTWIFKLNKSNIGTVSQSCIFPNNGETDKIILPENLLEVLSKDESIYPLFFSVKCLNQNTKSNNKNSIFTTHCGVLNYSEKPGYISLPEKILRCLDIKDNILLDENIWIELSYKRLQKGTYAQFELLNNNDILEVDNIRALLETYIGNYFNTLTVGDTIYINQLYNSSNRNIISKVKINKLEPENYISLINTDIQIEIISNIDKNIGNNNTNYSNVDEYSSDNIKTINIGNTERVSLYNRFKVTIPFELRKQLTNRDGDDHIAKLKIIIESEDKYDIFISFPPLFESSPHFYMLRSFPEDNNSLFISYVDIVSYFNNILNNKYNNSETSFPSILFIYIEKSEHLDKNTNKEDLSTIQVKIVYETANTNNINICDDSETKCEICNRIIPKTNLNLHLINCEKKYKKCDLCKLVIKQVEFGNHIHCDKCMVESEDSEYNNIVGFNRDELESHNKLYHEYIKCKLCNTSVKTIKLNVHQINECPKRMILCRYCNNYVEAGIDGYNADFRDIYYYNLTSHESYCGSRTTNCNICNNNVLFKNLESHIELCHNKK